MKKLYTRQWALTQSSVIVILLLSLFSHSAYSSYDSGYELGLERLKAGDVQGAMSIWSRMAETGDLNSQYSIGVLYEQQGPYQSHQQAIQYLTLASRQGMNQAQYYLAMKYFSGYGVEQDFNKTIQLLLKAAAKDYPEAQYQLGRMASDGLGFEKDPTEAIRWYLLAAENGFGPAQHTLSSHYMTGNGTVANVDKAVIWLNHAAEQEYMLAQRDLGFLYTQGMGVEKSYVKAAELLNNPATQGSPVSQYLLGQIYAAGGFGLDKSIRSARYWFKAAMSSGYPKAESALQQIAHLPAEAEVVENIVAEGSVPAPEVSQEDSDLVNLVDPESKSLDHQYYNFYNEDLSAYRNNTRQVTNLSDDWEYTEETTELNEDTLVEYNDIDQEFDNAFSTEARSIGGNRNYKHLFALQTDESDYTLRKERSFTPKLSSATKSNTESPSEAIVFRRASQTGKQKQIGLFPDATKKEVKSPEPATSHDVSTRIMQSNYRKSPVYSRIKTIAQSEAGSFQKDSARFVKLAGDNFTLQVLQSDSPVKAQQIAQKNAGQDDANLYILSTYKNNRPVYLVTYGAYSDRKKAESAAKALPQYVSIGTPWVRQISKIQQQIH